MSGRAERFNETELQLLRAAQTYFVVAQFLPQAVYFLGFGADRDKPVFPATISFTIRDGLPKQLHHLFWVIGWLHIAALMRKAKAALQFRTLMMFLNGVFGVVIYNLSFNKSRNRLHGLFAAIYMVEHIFLMRLFKHEETAFRGFGVSMSLFSCALVMSRMIERKYDIPGEAEAPLEVRRGRLKQQSRALQGLLFALGTVVMVFENGLFLAFTNGLA